MPILVVGRKERDIQKGDMESWTEIRRGKEKGKRRGRR
jgi:hypothetical protein